MITYSDECRVALHELLQRGGPLTAYRANPEIGVGPKEGSYAWKLERAIETRFRVKHAIVTNSGTAALSCALSASGLCPGAEVITSPLTFSASVAAILSVGGRPVFADVDPDTYCLAKESVKAAISQETRAILFTHLFRGQPRGCLGIIDLGFPVIEDACQAIGFRLGCRYVGGLGDVGAFSFGGSKQVPAGEGGCLVTPSDGIAYQARLRVNHGENFGGPYGYNYRPSEVTCCIALHGLQALKDNTPFLEPYVVEQRTPEDRPYMDRTLDTFNAFCHFRKVPLPVAHDLAMRSLCVHS